MIQLHWMLFRSMYWITKPFLFNGSFLLCLGFLYVHVCAHAANDSIHNNSLKYWFIDYNGECKKNFRTCLIFKLYPSSMGISGKWRIWKLRDLKEIIPKQYAALMLLEWVLTAISFSFCIHAQFENIPLLWMFYAHHFTRTIWRQNCHLISIEDWQTY